MILAPDINIPIYLPTYQPLCPSVSTDSKHSCYTVDVCKLLMMYVCSIDADRLNLELLSHIFVCSSEDLVSARLSIYLVVMATVLPGCHVVIDACYIW